MKSQSYSPTARDRWWIKRRISSGLFHAWTKIVHFSRVVAIIAPLLVGAQQTQYLDMKRHRRAFLFCCRFYVRLEHWRWADLSRATCDWCPMQFSLRFIGQHAQASNDNKGDSRAPIETKRLSPININWTQSRGACARVSRHILVQWKFSFFSFLFFVSILSSLLNSFTGHSFFLSLSSNLNSLVRLLCFGFCWTHES
jgi:hypothetical protein